MRISIDRFPAWASQVRFQSEGLQIEGLFFDEGGEFVGGISYAGKEQKKINEQIVIMMRTSLPPDLTELRTWLAHESGVYLGIDNNRLVEFKTLILRHHLTEAK